MFVGVDVGGTNTDAVLMDGQELAAAAKVPTTEDVTTGIVNAVTELLKQGFDSADIDAVMVGTTHFTNALLEQRGLSPTAVIRLALPATQLLPPMIDWPDALKDSIGGLAHTWSEAAMSLTGARFLRSTVTAYERQYETFAGRGRGR